MKYTYTKDFNIAYSLVDRTGRLGLVEFMGLNQDMITEFYGSVGSDNATLRIKSNAAWIYTRTMVKIVGELPFWNAKTRAVTYVSSMSAIRLELATDLYDEKGNLIIAAKTEMCAIDFDLRKIRKIDTLEFPHDLEVVESPITEGFSKLNVDFDSSDMAYSQKIFASDTDYSQHTNNVRYIKYIMNTFDSGFYDEKFIQGFEIQFAKESRDGDVLEVYKKNTGDNEYSFYIKNQDETVIKARLWVE